VEVVVEVGVAVTAITVCEFPPVGPPVTTAGSPEVVPLAWMPDTARLLKNVLLNNPCIFISNASKKVAGAPDTKGAEIPFGLLNVTDPPEVNPPADIKRVSVELV
jgi:hypothetical protein